jgi:hypothetical protein
MSIYEKPVRLLFKDFVAKQNITIGQNISKDQVISWFKGNYIIIELITLLFLYNILIIKLLKELMGNDKIPIKN